MFATIAAAGAVRRIVMSATLSALLVACGGGGGGDEPAAPTPPPPPTALPSSLDVTAPSGNTDLGATIAFGSNAADPANKLTYQWEFGDGTTSTLASPSHAYTKSGIFTLRVTITNEAGSQVSGSSTVAISDRALVKSKTCTAGEDGWCWQRPLPQGNVIADYFYVDDKRGWAVGEAGTILSTVDGGVTWTTQVSGTELGLTKVFFVDTQVGWVASTNGQLLKTIDGGATWSAASLGRNETATELRALDANSAWVITNFLSTYVTQDGGVRWSRVTAPADVSVQKYMPISTSDIWLFGYRYYYSSSVLLRSTNGGTSWSEAALPPVEAGLTRSLQNVEFVDALHGWVTAVESGYPTGGTNYVSRTLALRTSDGGATWQSFNQDPSLYGSTLQFVDANTGFAMPWYGGPVSRTTDGGMTWLPLPLPVFASGGYLLQLRAYSPQVLLAKDSNGRAYLSVDAGANWAARAADGGSETSLNSIWFFDSREGIAIASNGTAMRTTDGGQNWGPASPGSNSTWRQVQFLPDSSAGWIVSDAGTIYRSNDKGKSWVSPALPLSTTMSGLTDFHFPDGQHGWAVTPNNWSGSALFRTIDGGLSWQSVSGTESMTGMAAVRFADVTHGVIVGAGGLALITADGGQSWLPRPTGVANHLRRVAFLDEQTVVAVGDGGTIIRSLDRGHTWRKVQSFTPHALSDVRFVSATSGWALGESGVVLGTRDGGLTWTVQPTGTFSRLNGAFFLDELTGWVVGDNGRILVTATGGR